MTEGDHVRFVDEIRVTHIKDGEAIQLTRVLFRVGTTWYKLAYLNGIVVWESPHSEED